MSHSSEPLGIAAYQRSSLVTILRLVGDLDMGTTERLGAGIDEIDIGPGHWLVVHLADVGFVSSYGLSALLAARRRLRERGAELALYAPVAQVRRLIDITGLDGYLPILDEPDLATLSA